MGVLLQIFSSWRARDNSLLSQLVMRLVFLEGGMSKIYGLADFD